MAETIRDVMSWNPSTIETADSQAHLIGIVTQADAAQALRVDADG
jgi:hypothetical protein